MSTDNPLGLDDDETKSLQIFRPYFLRKASSAIGCNQRFVYYTTAETANLILGDRSVIMKQSSTMNDFREIEYGLNCIGVAWKKHKALLDTILDAVQPGFAAELWAWCASWEETVRTQTSQYVCPSTTPLKIDMGACRCGAPMEAAQGWHSLSRAAHYLLPQTR